MSNTKEHKTYLSRYEIGEEVYFMNEAKVVVKVHAVRFTLDKVYYDLDLGASGIIRDVDSILVSDLIPLSSREE